MTLEHLLHPRAADRALVADDDDVARVDPAARGRPRSTRPRSRTRAPGRGGGGARGRPASRSTRRAPGCPCRIAWPPVSLIGVSIGWTTCWPGVSTTSAAILAIVRPSTVRSSPWSRSRLSSSRMTRATPPASYMSAAAYRPPGRMSAISGVRSTTAAKSSSVSGMPNSAAIAGRWRAALVLPPVADDGRDRVLERVAGDDVRRPDVVVDERHDQLAGPARRLVLLRVLGRDAVEARRARGPGTPSRWTSCWP